MSKRMRQRRGKRSQPRVGYPSPAERMRIILQRQRLIREVTFLLVLDRDRERDRQIAQLARRYGSRNLEVVLDAYDKSMSGRDLIGEEAFLYRLYRHTFARFGGDRPFLGKPAYEQLTWEHAQLAGKRELLFEKPPPPSSRERELFDLLLIQSDYWEDITPPAVPPRPVDYDAPVPGEYGDPARELLEWGWDLEGYGTQYGQDAHKWRLAIPDLLRMTLDKGLLNGWPGEASSWAPYYALHMLGHLGAHWVAGHLPVLLNMENDWLSDKLSWVWAQMGSQVEPLLWEYVNDRVNDARKRNVALKGLELIAQLYPARRSDVIAGLARRLQLSSAEDAEMNGYIVFILNRMRTFEAGDAIVEAFEQEKVDTGIMTLEGVTFL